VKLNASKVGVYVALTLLSIPALLPLLWMVSTSLKGNEQIYGAASSGFSPSMLIPRPVVPQNYMDAMQTVPFMVYLRNTLLLCILTVIGAVVSSAVVAYGFAKINFAGSKTLFALMIATMALPGQVTMIPVFSLFRWLGW